MSIFIHSCLWLTLAALASCANSEPEGNQQPDIGYTEYGLVVGDFFQFYIGKEVLSEARLTGAFSPSATKKYSYITVPLSLIEALKSDPVGTYSLCDETKNIVFGNHIPLHGEQRYMIPTGGINQNKHVSFTDSEMTERYKSGDAGVFGTLKLGINKNGHYQVGLSANLCVPLNDGGFAGGGMLLGSSVGSDSSREDTGFEACMDNGVCGN